MRFDNPLPATIDLVIPGFELSYPRGTFKTLSLDVPRSSEEWFQEFVVLAQTSIRKSFLPIYRMADGEYSFAVGYRFRYRANGEPPTIYLFRRFKSLIGRSIRWRPGAAIRAGGRGTDYNYESGRYGSLELRMLRDSYGKQLRSISRHGVLAMMFSYRREPFAQQYFVPIVRWLKLQRIELTSGNYYPFYFVYALLNGPSAAQIYDGRRVLVVTSYNEDKRRAIQAGLKRQRVSDVQWIPISRNRSMVDQIDLSAIKQPIDLVLVGAGIGASNILLQLEPLHTLAIDAGFCLECLATPALKQRRTFCWPDSERSGSFDPV